MAAHLSTSPPERELLDPSELGTREYWNALYAREIHNFEQDRDDEGTVWFSESNAEAVVQRELSRLAEEGILVRGDDEDTGEAGIPARFCDLGTGNGHMLFALREQDDDDRCWRGEMVGVDYSEPSVQLARGIAARDGEGEEKGAAPVRFECWDLLTQVPGEWLDGGFDVVLDKGTFDAVSLMPREDASRQPHPCEVYRDKVAPLVKPGKYLFVTSCNWTKDEVVRWLAPEGGQLQFWREPKYPSFTFGGQTGQSVVTVIFRKI